MPRATGWPKRPAKQLKNVKLSSKSASSPQELLNSSRNTNTKRLKNVKQSLKSVSMISERPKPSQDVIIACTRASNKRSYTSKIKRTLIQQPQNEQRCYHSTSSKLPVNDLKLQKTSDDSQERQGCARRAASRATLSPVACYGPTQATNCMRTRA